MTSAPERPPLTGDAAVYTRPVLAIYDPIALGLVCPLAWRCSRRTMLDFYDRQISADHLDVGPGSGYFLDKCRLPTPEPRIGLVDLSPAVLDTVRHRIARYRPMSYLRDVLQPFDLGEERYETAAVMNVLHCLPGTMREKTAVLEEAASYVEPGGKVFGSTVLGADVPLGRFGRWMMRQYNAAGSFMNEGDSLPALTAALDERFESYEVWTRGAMAFFTIDV